ncbi:MAG: ABC transporter permease [Chloroflexia bacterium]|nr:ABC transporter permease [Chloroflexia bacterium]
MASTSTQAAPAARPRAARPALPGLRQPPTLLVGGVLLAVVVALAVLAPLLTPYGPLDQDLLNAKQPPSWSHPFGTDNFGRDVLTRVLFGARVDLLIGLVPTAITFVVGVSVGAVAGYFGGRVDAILMRLVDIAVAFPFFVLLIAIVAMLGPGLRNMIVAISLVGWISYARIVRGEVLVARQAEYVLAARTLGFGDARIIVGHLLPNVITAAIVFSMADVVLNILLGTALSFLGLGPQAPTAEWGRMIQEGRQFIASGEWWMTTFPGLAIVVVAVAFSLIGDGLADLLRVEDRV